MQSSKFVSGFTPNLMPHGSNRRVSFLAALRSVSDNLIQHQSAANQRRNAEMRRLQHAVVHLDDRIHYSAPDRGAEYCYDRVCLSVCVCVFVCSRSYLRNYRPDLHRIFVHVTCYGSGLVLLWWRSDTLNTSGFWMTSCLYIMSRRIQLHEKDARLKHRCKKRFYVFFILVTFFTFINVFFIFQTFFI